MVCLILRLKYSLTSHLSPLTSITHHLREPDEGEENGANEKEGTEEAKVAQGCCTEGNQGEESTNGGDIAHHKGFNDFFQRLTHIARMIQMGNEV